MQPEATSTGTAPPSGAAPSSGGGGAGGMPPGCQGASSQMVMLAVMFAVFYFLLIRPQQKKQREIDDMLKALKKGDKVRTSGGIRGEIVDITDTDVNLLIADKVKINVLRSHIAARIGASGESAAEDSKAKAAG
jgi:preprotein translocase subunit YajC